MRLMTTLTRGALALLLAALLPLSGAHAWAHANTSRQAAGDLRIAYSTVWGDRGQATANFVATDRAGDTYVAGETDDPDGTHVHAFVAKFGPAGARLYTTYLPNGACDAAAAGLAVDARGDAYVVGQAKAPGDAGGCGVTQVFAAKLDPRGGVAYNVRYGHSSSDREVAQAVAVDARGDAYLTGAIFMDPTFRTTPGALVPDPDGPDSLGVGLSFVMKLDGAGHLAYSTLLGNAHHWGAGESGEAIAVDARGDAFVAGQTASAAFPVTANAYQRAPRGDGTPYVAELDPSGGRLLYATYLGGSGASTAAGIGLDAAGRIYVVGETSAMDFPTTPDAYQRLCGTYGGCNSTHSCSQGSYDPQNQYCFFGSFDQAFVAELDPDPALPAARTLVYSTYLGGNVHDGARGLAVLGPGRVVVGGFTTSLDFPSLHGVQRRRTGKKNAFVTWLDLRRPGRAALLASTYLGGSGEDTAAGVAADAAGAVYVAGATTSPDFPRAAVPQAPGAAASGGAAAFVTKFKPFGGAAGSDGSGRSGGSRGGTHGPSDGGAGGTVVVSAAGLLHEVKGKAVVTTTLRRGEAGIFVALYTTRGPGASTPAGHLTIDEGRRTIVDTGMTSDTGSVGQRYAYAAATLADAGSYVAHLRLTLGTSTQTRDVPFTVMP